MESPDFSTLIIDRTAPLQSQLYKQLVSWICTGRLQPGARLVSSRKLAAELDLSRNTVTLVFEQLKAEGFFSSEQRRGIYVSKSLPSHASKPESGIWGKQTKQPGLSRFTKDIQKLPSTKTKVTFPFTPGLPDLSVFPTRIWGSISRRNLDRPNLKGYGGCHGYPLLRQALAHYLTISRGVRCREEQIIITNGAQEALSLCAKVILDQGDTAFIENPGYRRVIQAFRSQHVKLEPVPLKNSYLDINKLLNSKPSGKALYCSPTHQYPLGGIMPASERIQLLDWAANNGTWILEDDYDSEYSFHQKPVAALQGMADQTPVLYMGSFSKTLFPALRIGYLVVPEELVETFSKVKSYFSGETCLLNQAITADFIVEGHFVRHLRRMRNHYRAKWEHFDELIRCKLDGLAQPIGNSAGMHTVIETPDIDDEKLRLALMQQGFGGASLSSYYLGKPMKQGLVLGFSNTSAAQREAFMKAFINSA